MGNIRQDEFSSEKRAGIFSPCIDPKRTFFVCQGEEKLLRECWKCRRLDVQEQMKLGEILCVVLGKTLRDYDETG